MKKILSGVLLLFILVLPAIFVKPVHASSQQAYNDYLYQFDIYRQKYSDFEVAKNAYLKYGTLDSQSQALSATKFMLTARDTLLHAYLVYLYERVGEQQGMSAVTKQTYQSLLSNELAFLENQSSLVSSINSIDDATSTSQQLEDHYAVLSATIDQIIAGVELGQLNVIAQNFAAQVTAAQTIISQNSASISQDQRSTITNWLQEITSKQALYQQKINDINAAVATLANVTDPTSLDQTFTDVTNKIGDAKQYMSDSIANLGEVVTALQYTN